MLGAINEAGVSSSHGKTTGSTGCPAPFAPAIVIQMVVERKRPTGDIPA
jgi:hypothetical protein